MCVVASFDEYGSIVWNDGFYKKVQPHQPKKRI